jgi:NAD(P)-dependent dehydrogenase (short-subunit alcohol dehydrogenase family)
MVLIEPETTMTTTRTAPARGADATTNHDLLPGLRVAITGGTSGLGRALAATLAHAGAHVAILARGRAALSRTQAALPGVHAIALDVARKDDIYPAALQISGLLGGLDVLINNASSLGPVPLALLGDTQCEDLELALRTNVLGPFRLTKALLGALAASAREGRGAVVVNISSDAAVNPYAAWGAYGASKAALHHLTRIWDEEAREHGIRFLSIDPGDMDTPLHALAVPDADAAALKQPGVAAREIVAAIVSALPQHDHAGEAGADAFAWDPA